MRIAFIVYPQTLVTGVSVPLEMFNAAALVQTGSVKKTLDVSFVASKKGPVTVTAGLQLVAEYDFNDELEVDWVFIPPMWGTPWPVLQSESAMQDWIVKKYSQGSRIIATGTGVGHLAMAGLLNNKVATTHWYYLPHFKRRFPNVKFQSKYFITHQEGIYCAGSINAQTDLVLYFINREFGEQSLALVEQQFMHELKRNFAIPFYEPGGNIHEDEVVSHVQNWIRSHHHESITLNQMAEVAGQSERQLRRRFSQAAGESPLRYLQRVRIEEAQNLLRETNLSITDIALTTGFGSSAYFSRAFKQHTRLKPGDYRRVVRQKRFSSG